MSAAATVRTVMLWPFDRSGARPAAPDVGSRRPLGAVGRDSEAPDPPGALTAGAQIITLGKNLKPGQNADGIPPRRRGWQTEAWDYYDALGEVKYAINYLANAMSKCRLYVGWIAEPGKPPIPIEDAVLGEDDQPEPGRLYPTQELADDARNELARLKHPQGGQAELQRLAGLNLGVAGEGFLVGVPPQPGIPADPITGKGGQPPQPEWWDLFSIEEIDFTEDRDGVHAKILDLDDPGSPANGGNTGNPGGKDLPDDALIVRVYRRHGRRHRLADSAMRGVLSDCEELLLLNRQIRSTARSRLAGAGLLLIPTELDFSKRPGPGGSPDAGGQAQGDPFGAYLMETMVTPLADEANAASVVPTLVRGKGEFLQYVRHITLDRPMDAVAAQQRQEKRQVLATGLDIPPELLTGKGDLNHWTAWQVDEDTFQGHVEPSLQLTVSSFTVGFLRPALADTWPEPLLEHLVIWYDASDVISRPNRFNELVQLHERGLISDDYMRNVAGIGEEAKPEVGELLTRLLWQRGMIDAPISEALIRYVAPDIVIRRAVRAGEEIVDDQEGVPPPEDGGTPVDPANEAPSPSDTSGPPPVEVAEPAAPNDAPADAPGGTHTVTAAGNSVTAAGRRRSGAVLGRRLQRVDRRAADRLHAACEAALLRALERAGNRLATRAPTGPIRAAITPVPRWQACAQVGSRMLTAAGIAEDDLLTDDFSDLADVADLYLSDAQLAALEAVGSYVGLDPAQRDRVQARQDVHRAAAVAALVGAMSALARKRLYDPRPDAPPVGEADLSSSVPRGIIRKILAIAGGNGASPDSGGLSNDGSRVLDGDGRPAGGIGNGDVITETLTDNGVQQTGYVWVYGVSTRPFEPHLELDQIEFTDWTDEALTNPGDWPDVPYLAPGDHDGCNCDFQITYTDESASGDTILPTRVGIDTESGLPSRVSTGEPGHEPADVGTVAADQITVDA